MLSSFSILQNALATGTHYQKDIWAELEVKITVNVLQHSKTKYQPFPATFLLKMGDSNSHAGEELWEMEDRKLGKATPKRTLFVQ